MAGIRENKKIVKHTLNKMQMVKLAHEILLSKYEGLTVGGIVKLLNSGYDNKIRKSRGEVLFGYGIILEGRDIRCLLKH